VHKCSKEEDVAALVDEAVRQYGRLDVMVNNAGRMQQNNHTPLDQIRIQDFDATFKLNVRGTLLGIMHAARCATNWTCSPVGPCTHAVILFAEPMRHHTHGPSIFAGAGMRCTCTDCCAGS